MAAKGAYARIALTGLPATSLPITTSQSRKRTTAAWCPDSDSSAHRWSPHTLSRLILKHIQIGLADALSLVSPLVRIKGTKGKDNETHLQGTPVECFSYAY